MELRKVKYVGNKPSKPDTVCGTGMVWERGEVKDLDKEIAENLCRYPEVWKDVTVKNKSNKPNKPSKPTDPPSVSSKIDEESKKEEAEKNSTSNGGVALPPLNK